MSFPKRSSKQWKDQEWLKTQGIKYHKAGRNIPEQYPKDFELKDASGKVFMRLKRGQPVEIVGDAPPEILKSLEAAKEALPTGPVSRMGIPQNRASIPLPSQAGPAQVGPTVPASEAMGPEIYGLIADIERSFIPEEDSKYWPANDDATCQRLYRIQVVAFPGVQLNPKVAYVIAIVLWQAKVIVWVIKKKGKQIVEWFKRLGKKKTEPEQKLPEAKE
jgi:hypothetical protein